MAGVGKTFPSMDAGSTDDVFERITALLARLLGASSAQVSLADDPGRPLRDEPFVVADARRDGDDGGATATATTTALPPGVAACVSWPLRVDGRVVGALSAHDTRPRAWTPDDLALVEELAGLAERLLAARDGARAERERQSAQSARRDEVAALSERLQLALLPRHQDDVRFHTAYEPGSDRLLLGGDFADVRVAADGSLDLVIGDVSGHGPEAAALASALRASWGTLRRHGVGVSELLEELDRVVVAERADDDLYATILVATLDRNGRLCVSSAGHPAPIIVGRPAREAEIETGMLLGSELGGTWPTTAVDTGGHCVMLYTDGLIEGRAAVGAAERFGLDRLLAALDARGDIADEALGAYLITAATAANGAPLPDDVTTLLVGA
jgi:serine phosphatase RsbU (regulator of sigma subunit)